MANIPTATVSRLVTYLRIVTYLEAQEVARTSSEHLAREAQVSAFQVRKDLAYFGRFGTRGAGYGVPTLRQELRRILGLTRPWNVAILGMGRLGAALADYPNFDEFDFQLRAAFDVDPDKIGRHVAGIEVRHPDALSEAVRAEAVEIGFITVPPHAAQEAADRLVAAGISGILNFAPAVINVPEDVRIEPVDFLASLKRLAFYIKEPRIEEESA